MNTKYYVTTTDKLMSGWGMADKKINKLIFICDDYKEAEIVAKNASNRSDQKHVNIVQRKPYYNSNRYYAQIKTKEEYPKWYVEGSF